MTYDPNVTYAGPYSSNVYNFDYQNQLADTGAPQLGAEQAVTVNHAIEGGTYQSTVANPTTAYGPVTAQFKVDLAPLEAAYTDAIARGDVLAMHAALDAYNAGRAADGLPNVPAASVPSDLSVLTHSTDPAVVSAALAGLGGATAVYAAPAPVTPAAVSVPVQPVSGGGGVTPVAGPNWGGSWVDRWSGQANAGFTASEAFSGSARSAATFLTNQVHAIAWSATGTISADSSTINWDNGNQWVRSAAAPPPAAGTNQTQGTAGPDKPPSPAGTDAGNPAAQSPSATGSLASQVQALGGGATVLLNPDQWGYYFSQAAGIAAPAPEDLGFTGDARFASMKFAAYWTALTAWAWAKGNASSPVAKAVLGSGTASGGTSSPTVIKSPGLLELGFWGLAAYLGLRFFA